MNLAGSLNRPPICHPVPPHRPSVPPSHPSLTSGDKLTRPPHSNSICFQPLKAAPYSSEPLRSPYSLTNASINGVLEDQGPFMSSPHVVPSCRPLHVVPPCSVSQELKTSSGNFWCVEAGRRLRLPPLLSSCSESRHGNARHSDYVPLKSTN